MVFRYKNCVISSNPLVYNVFRMNLVSAGGIVYRKDADSIFVVVCGRNCPISFNLPKGTPEPHETRGQTALREVEEETGLRVQLGKYIDSVNYWVTNHPDYPGQQLRKTVYYYLMEPIGGDFSRHDEEFDTVDWVDIRDISKTLSFENEVKIVQKGISLVKGRT
ncbi:MAG TPA: NUDIX domain-containing protein [Dehalococcoidia bacterium]|jgi:8-oxo-dGTP diphosphatase|nr:NUDIX domain-containing protein [Dehalococcoidia bacterium]